MLLFWKTIKASFYFIMEILKKILPPDSHVPTNEIKVFMHLLQLLFAQGFYSIPTQRNERNITRLSTMKCVSIKAILLNAIQQGFYLLRRTTTKNSKALPYSSPSNLAIFDATSAVHST